MKNKLYKHLPFIYFCLTIVIGALLRTMVDKELLYADPMGFVVGLWLAYIAFDTTKVFWNNNAKHLVFTISLFLWALSLACMIFSFIKPNFN